MVIAPRPAQSSQPTQAVLLIMNLAEWVSAPTRGGDLMGPMRSSLDEAKASTLRMFKSACRGGTASVFK